MALRRLKPLLGAFEQIDAAIEAADAVGCGRAELRSARARIVEMVCEAADDGAEKAEGICALLDETMGEALATLREVPAEKIALESGDLVGAVGALMREHPSERVRGLAGDVACGWRASVTGEVESARARAAMVLGSIFATPPPPLDATAPAANSDMKLKKKIQQEQPLPRKTAVATSSRRVRTVETYAPLSKTRSDPIVSSSYANPVPEQPKKMMPPVVAGSVAEEEKLEKTKRKLQERYQEIEDAKRRRTIQVIKTPRPRPGTASQRKGNAHLAVRARAPANCAANWPNHARFC
ncbi:unnamed protein product [Urochloa decumbens]|uniref:TFIIS N-terminal domain-containing protein n=1 Tax=Urochloa decumbens TaxID=240449 RepID=A0ABC9BI79_9POAL